MLGATILSVLLLLLMVKCEESPGVEPQNPRNLEPIPSLFSLNTCQYLRNISDVETLNRHQFEILEQCLYYYLAAEAQRKAQYFNAIQALSAFPPEAANARGSRVKLFFHQITLQHFVMNEFLKELNINGYISIFWDDSRLSWNEEHWKLKKMEINSVNHIWIPMLTAQTFDTAVRNGDLMEIRRVSINSTGTIRAIINFSLRTFCDDSDFKNFPNDMYKCCYQIEPHMNQAGIEFITSGRPVFTDGKYFRDYGWYISGSTPTVQIMQDSQIPQLGFCLNLKRSANSLHIELSLPNIITSILFLLTPLLGQINLQIFAKMFVLFLQFSTLQLYSMLISPHLSSSASTPNILRFLEFATIINTFSISVSIILWMCCKIRRNLPPWNWLIRTSELINRFICVFNSTDNCISLNDNDKSSTANGYQEDWTNAFIAIHGVAVFVLSLIFILGYLMLS
ncbi:Neurotransmitter-gated ion-channel ligand binding domain family protein [Brugia pahangi]